MMIENEIKQYRIWSQTHDGTPRLHNNRFEPSKSLIANITDDRALYIDSVLCRFSKRDRAIYICYYASNQDFNKIIGKYGLSVDQIVSIRDKIDRAIYC